MSRRRSGGRTEGRPPDRVGPGWAGQEQGPQEGSPGRWPEATAQRRESALVAMTGRERRVLSSAARGAQGDLRLSPAGRVLPPQHCREMATPRRAVAALQRSGGFSRLAGEGP